MTHVNARILALAALAFCAGCIPDDGVTDAGPGGAVGGDPSVCRGAETWKSVSLDIVATKVAAADFDGDGLDDLAWFNAQGVVGSLDFGLWFALSNGDGSFAEPVRIAPENFRHIDVVDVNQDGRPDLVLTALSGTAGIGGVFVYAWQPDTRHFSENLYAGPTTAGAFRIQAHIDVGLASDLDGDGHVEVLASDISTVNGGPPLLLPGTGPGTFGEGVFLDAVGQDGFVTGFAAADLNGDGLKDVIMGHQDDVSTGASIVLQDTALTFHPPVFSDIGGSGFPLIEDVDEDGRPDLLWGSVLYRGLGGADFGPFERVAADYTLIARDLDGDGRLDLVGGLAELDGVSFPELVITWGTGPAAFEATADRIAIPPTNSVAAGNFDGARGVDFVIDGVGGPGALTVLLSRCTDG